MSKPKNQNRFKRLFKKFFGPIGPTEKKSASLQANLNSYIKVVNYP